MTESASETAHESRRRLIEAQKLDLRLIDDPALNAEASPEQLDHPLTPAHAFFVRNNGSMPQIAPDAAKTWTLAIDGEVARPKKWLLEELKTSFEVVTETAVLECAGNGRVLFTPPADGLQWTHGAVGCARWTGVRLRDVLIASGIRESAVYTGHYSPDVLLHEAGKPALSRGLPIPKAMAPETLLCFAMNDEPLPPLHGAPLRIVAPGFPGSAWQKWLTRIWVRDREHDGEKMTGTNYRLPRRPVAPGSKPDANDFAVIVDMPVKSMITAPAEGATLRAGEAFELRGFAWSGHVPVASVEVSGDGGRTWQVAELAASAAPFAWRRFRAMLTPAGTGQAILMARATDRAGHVQPLGSAPWNPRGYCNNAAHRVRVEISA
jgi:DMSO/TMAO reductase YedYZ molybdopterin-dependent catalytic subunit